MLVVAGLFDQAGNTTARNLAMFDGERWTGLSSPLLATTINTVCVHQGCLIVAGSTYLNPNYVETQIASFDGVSWSSLGTVAPLSASSGGVLTLKAVGDALYVGGYFSAINGSPFAGIARWDGHAWSGLGNGLPGSGATALEEFQGKLIAAGSFLWAGDGPVNSIASWDGHTWSRLGAGLAGSVYSLTIFENALIVGGSFQNAGGQVTRCLARWDGQTWDVMGGGLLGINFLSISMLTVYEGQLLAGCIRNPPSQQPFDMMARWDGSQWAPMRSPCFGKHGQIRITQAAEFRGKLVVAASDMIYMDGVYALGLAQWDGLSWTSVCPGMGIASSDLALSVWPRIMGMTMFEGDLVVGGSFESIGGVDAQNIARWDGSVWRPLGAGLDTGFSHNGVGPVTVYRGELMASVLYPGNTTAVMKWNGATWVSLGLSPAGWGPIVVFQDELYASAQSPEIPNGQYGLFRWNGGSWRRVPDFRATLVSCLHAESDRLLVGGNNLNLGAQGFQAMSWNGSAFTPLPRTPDFRDVVQLTAFDGSTYAVSGSAGGDAFGSMGSTYRLDGAAWTNLQAGTRVTRRPDSLLPFRGGLLLSGAGMTISPSNTPLSLVFWDGTRWSAFGPQIATGICLPYAGGLAASTFNSNSNGQSNAFILRWGQSEGPTFDHQPAPQTICASGRTSFLAPATGSEGLAYRWQFRLPTAGGWGEWQNALDGPNVDASGETQFIAHGSASFTLTTQPPTGISTDPLGWVNRTVGLRCRVAGDCRTIESNAVELRIHGADVNCDGLVNADDLSDFLEWFESGDPRGDVNHDGAVDFFDYDNLVVAIETCC
ncbi:MAG: hypothetical protein AABZ53_02620 [Planctomycetota bacterium]